MSPRKMPPWARYAVTAFAALIATAAIAACGSSKSGSSGEQSGSTKAASSASGGAGGSGETLKVALVQAATADLPVEVAASHGLFTQEGINVKAETPSVPFSQLPATLGKQFDLVIGSQPDLITAASKGINVVAAAGLQRDNPKDPGAALVVKKGSPIKSIKDLAGKSVGAPSVVGNNWSSLLCWAQKEGVSPSQIRGLEAPTPEIPELLQAGRFEAALVFEPLLTPMVEKGDVNLGDAYTKCFDKTAQYTAYWLAEGTWAKQHQELIGKFIKALDKAKEVMAKEPEAVRALYLKTSGLPKAAAQRTPIIPEEFTFEQGAPIEANVTEWVTLLQKLGLFHGSVKASDVVLSPSS